MQVSVEARDETNPLAREMTVEIPKERFADEIEKRFKSLARKAKINGFRPGKVPLRVVKQKYGLQVRQEVSGEILEESLQEAVEQEKLRIAGQPNIKLNGEIKDVDAEGLSFTADFEVFPEIELQLEGLSLEKFTAEVADVDVENMLDKLRQQKAEWTPLEDTAIALGHRVNLDFSATVDGQAFENSEMQDLSLVLENKPMFSQEFEDKLLGAKAGDELAYDVQFDADHSNSDIAGKLVQFKVTVHEVAEAHVPELDEAFVQTLGIESGDLEAFKADVRDNLSRELDNALKNKLKRQVMDVLIEANPIQVPQILLQSEKERLVERINSELAMYGQERTANPDDYTEVALKRVRQGLLMAELIRINDLQASPEKVQAEVTNMASTYEDPSAFINWLYSEPERMQEIEAVVLEEEAIEWLLERIEVTEKQTDFDSIMNKPADNSDNNTDTE